MTLWGLKNLTSDGTKMEKYCFADLMLGRWKKCTRTLENMIIGGIYTSVRERQWNVENVFVFRNKQFEGWGRTAVDVFVDFDLVFPWLNLFMFVLLISSAIGYELLSFCLYCRGLWKSILAWRLTMIWELSEWIDDLCRGRKSFRRSTNKTGVQEEWLESLETWLPIKGVRRKRWKFSNWIWAKE